MEGFSIFVFFLFKVRKKADIFRYFGGLIEESKERGEKEFITKLHCRTRALQFLSLIFLAFELACLYQWRLEKILNLTIEPFFEVER